MDPQHPKVYWRDYIPSADTPRSKELAVSDTYEWASARCSEPFIAGWKAHWESLQAEPYKGISTDGQIRKDLYHLADEDEDNGAHETAMVDAAQKILAAATPQQRKALLQPLDALEWRRWMNPELYVYRHGVRLEQASESFVTAVHDLMRASLSPEGYAKASGCMKVNDFLGEVVNGRKVLNERSYNFTLFGTSQAGEPWGWQVHGHHFAMNCFTVGSQLVISPVFMGAEPNVIDEGPNEGVELFTDQEWTVLELIASLDGEAQYRVQVYKELSGAVYPEWRYHKADQRHLGGAFQDNRVIPYEGVIVTSLPVAQQRMIKQLLHLSLNYLPEKALIEKMAEIDAHWYNTHFCWIGEVTSPMAFYYKIHSPVVLIEFDHHSGVFLSNKEPLPFHIHTLVRTPNGNDYGKALLRQYQLRECRNGTSVTGEAAVVSGAK